MSYALHASRQLLTSLFVLASGLPMVMAATEPIVPNSSFEEKGGQGPEAWSQETWGGRGQFEYASEGRTGRATRAR